MESSLENGEPEIRLLTSILWIYRSDEVSLSSSDVNLTDDEQERTKKILDETQPDLGLLPLHRDRMAAAVQALGWQQMEWLYLSDSTLQLLRRNIETVLKRAVRSQGLDTKEAHEFKVQIRINKLGMPDIEADLLSRSFIGLQSRPFMPSTFSATHAPSLPVCQVFIDTQPTRPSIFTTHKTSTRTAYDDARARLGISRALPTHKEVLLYNDLGEVMETSLCTVYVFQEDRWLTPAILCGGNVGVTRRLALEMGLCQQGSIEVMNLKNGDRIWLSNAVRGFFMGEITPRSDQDGDRGIE